MTRPVDALGELLWIKLNLDREDADKVAQVCLRAIAEGKVVTRERIAQTIHGVSGDGPACQRCESEAAAILALFGEET